MVMPQQVAEGLSQGPRPGTDEFGNKVTQLLGELRVESEALQREATEIDMLIRQSNMEVEKLANRENAVTNRVRDMELNLDNYSRTDMKTIYNSAHEIQMRLFMMRAQVEQLEAKRNSMRLLQNRLQKVTSVLLSAPEGYNPGMSQPAGPRQIQMQATQTISTPLEDALDSKQVIGQVIQAQEDERLRVSRQIHDGPAQTMTNLVLRAEICERLRARSPHTRVLLISGAGRILPNAAKAAGAAGFVSKDWPAADIAGAVRMVGLGMTVFKPHEAPAGPPLSDREREVLEAVASGATNREIAGRLFLSPHTVKEHTSSLYRKLGARNRAEAVQKAQRIGLIS